MTFFITQLVVNVLFLIIINVIFSTGRADEQKTSQPSKLTQGLVYYPPYTDPYNYKNPCSPFHEWNLPEDNYISPEEDQNKDCRGSFNLLPFYVPKLFPTNTIAYHNELAEIVEDFTIDANLYRSKSYNIHFNCKDQAGRNKSGGLFFWIYRYRHSASGVVNQFSNQTKMSWDTEGRMLYQPSANDVNIKQANISCRFYDHVKGYFVPVRTWRLVFKRTPPANTRAAPSTTVQIVECGIGVDSASSPRANLLTSDQTVNVLVTAYRLEFPAFCPIVSCQQGENIDGYLPITYYPRQQDCSSDTPASYPICQINPFEQNVIDYSCSAAGTGYGAVKINFHSGARFTNEHEEFRPYYLREDDRDVTFSCSVDPKTAPDVTPIWDFLSPESYFNGRGLYQTLPLSSLFKQIDDPTTGHHRLVIAAVKTEHEGSYRCQVQQSQKIISGGGKPIFGYYFVKVYTQPLCTPYDGNSRVEMKIVNQAVRFQLPTMINTFISMRCSQIVFTHCQNGHDVCEPIAVLRKNGRICSASNATTANFCGGTQKINMLSHSSSLLRLDFALHNNKLEVDDAVVEDVRGTYVVQLVYPPPMNLVLEVPFKIIADNFTEDYNNNDANIGITKTVMMTFTISDVKSDGSSSLIDNNQWSTFVTQLLTVSYLFL